MSMKRADRRIDTRYVFESGGACINRLPAKSRFLCRTFVGKFAFGFLANHHSLTRLKLEFIKKGMPTGLGEIRKDINGQVTELGKEGMAFLSTDEYGFEEKLEIVYKDLHKGKDNHRIVGRVASLTLSEHGLKKVGIKFSRHSRWVELISRFEKQELIKEKPIFQPIQKKKTPILDEVLLELNSSHWQERFEATLNVGSVCSSGMIFSILKSMVSDKDFRVRIAAIDRLNKLFGQKAIPVLSDRLRNDPNGLVRESAANLMGKNHQSEAVSLLMDALCDREPYVVIAAIKALEGHKDLSIQNRVKSLLENCHDRRVRKIASTAVERLATPEKMPVTTKSESWNQSESTTPESKTGTSANPHKGEQ
jgi:hypothetical protein